MKMWHWVVAAIVLYSLGALYPGPFQMVRSKITG